MLSSSVVRKLLVLKVYQICTKNRALRQVGHYTEIHPTSAGRVLASIPAYAVAPSASLALPTLASAFFPLRIRCLDFAEIGHRPLFSLSTAIWASFFSTSVASLLLLFLGRLVTGWRVLGRVSRLRLVERFRQGNQ
jgi:hypothetical protein